MSTSGHCRGGASCLRTSSSAPAAATGGSHDPELAWGADVPMWQPPGAAAEASPVPPAWRRAGGGSPQPAGSVARSLPPTPPPRAASLPPPLSRRASPYRLRSSRSASPDGCGPWNPGTWNVALNPFGWNLPATATEGSRDRLQPSEHPTPSFCCKSFLLVCHDCITSRGAAVPCRAAGPSPDLGFTPALTPAATPLHRTLPDGAVPQLATALTIASPPHLHPRRPLHRTLPDGAVFVPYSSGWPAMEWSAQRFVLPPPVAALPGQSATGLHPFTPPGFAPPLSPFTPVTQLQPELQPEPATQRDRLEPVHFCFPPPGQPDPLQPQQQQPPMDPAVLMLLSSGYSPGISTQHTDAAGASANPALHTAGGTRDSGDYSVGPQPVLDFAAAWVPVAESEPLSAAGTAQQEDGLMRWQLPPRHPLQPMELATAASAVQGPLVSIAPLEGTPLVLHSVGIPDGVPDSPCTIAKIVKPRLSRRRRWLTSPCRQLIMHHVPVSVLRPGPQVLMLGCTPISCHVARTAICCGCAAVPILDHGRAAGAAGPMRSPLAVPTGVGEPQMGGGGLAQWPQLGMAVGATAMEPGMVWLMHWSPVIPHYDVWARSRV